MTKAEYEAKIVLKAIRTTEKNSWVQLAVLREAVSAPPAVWEKFALKFDAYWEKERRLDYRHRMREKK